MFHVAPPELVETALVILFASVITLDSLGVFRNFRSGQRPKGKIVGQGVHMVGACSAAAEAQRRLPAYSPSAG